MIRIVVNPGHGGKDPGAIGPTGLREADVNLAIANHLTAILRGAGITVFQTRTDDRFQELGDICRVVNSFHPVALVSIHCNAATNRSADGYEVWTSPGQTNADHLAEHVLLEYGGQMRGHGMRLRADTTDGDLDKEAHLAVLTGTLAPAILVEVGFISCPTREADLREPRTLASMAEGIAAGIFTWLAEGGKTCTPA